MLLSKFGEKGKAADVVFSFPRSFLSEFYSSLIVLIARQGHCLGWGENRGNIDTVSRLGFSPQVLLRPGLSNDRVFLFKLS